MKTEQILIQNLKCGGCASTIKNKLSALEGVQEVVVDVENNIVNIRHSDVVQREAMTELLLKIGYPEDTAPNDVLTKAKSYVSCMIGRVNS